MAVIRPEIETDPAELEQIAIEYLQDAIPGWEPADGDLMTWLIGAHARMVAEERDIAADVPLEQILRPLGEQVHLVVPKLALPATVNAIVTMRDRAGYTVPQGTEVLVRTAGDDGVTMIFVSDVTVPPGSLSSLPVELEAAPGREGAAGNGRTARDAVVPIRQLEFIRSIAIAPGAVSANGRDAETDEEYLQRLVDTLALASPTPILPDDFAAIARQVDGVERALAINLLVDRPFIVDWHQVDTAFEGHFYFGGGYAAVSWGSRGPATADQVRAQLEYASAVVDVTGAYPTYRFTFPAIPGGYEDDTWLVEGWDYNGPRLPWTVIQENAYQAVAERAITVAVVDERGEKPADTALTAVRTTLESMRETNWLISVIGPTYTDIRVDFTVAPWPDHDPVTVVPAAVAAITDYLSPANWGRGKDGDQTGDATWVQEPVVRYLEVAKVLNDVPGVHYIDNLRLDGGSGWVQGNVSLRGRAPLPRPVARGITGRVIGG